LSARERWVTRPVEGVEVGDEVEFVIEAVGEDDRTLRIPFRGEVTGVAVPAEGDADETVIISIESGGVLCEKPRGTRIRVLVP
jgi:hypothetical protein